MNDLEKYINTCIEGKKPSHALLKKYRANIGAKGFVKITENDSKKLLEGSIIFVSDRPNYFFLRVSYALKLCGLKTVLLTRWGVSKEQLVFFDHIILFDKISDLKKLKRIDRCTFYVQSWIGWNFLYLYIKQIVQQKVLCNINDLSNLLFNNTDHLKLIGLSDYEIQKDLEYEKQILETADLVTIPYRLNALKQFDSPISKRLGSKIINFPCYPLKKFFYNNIKECKQPRHLFYAGMIPYDEKTDMVFSDAKMHKSVKQILEQQLPLTIFNNPQHTMTMNEETITKKYNFFSSLSKQYNSFNFKTGFMPWDLKNHIKSFHYGTILHSYPKNFYINQVHYEEILPSKIYTYMEAGLPLMIVDKLTAASELIMKHKIGIVVPESKFNSLNKIIHDHSDQYQKLIKNIINFRNQYCMENMVATILKTHLLTNERIVLRTL